MDPIARRHRDRFRSLANEGVTVFVTTHYMDEARRCDRIVLIDEGKIVSLGSPSEIIRSTFPERPDAGLNECSSN